MQLFCIPQPLTPLHNTHQKSTVSSVLGNVGCREGSSHMEIGYMEQQIIIVTRDVQLRDAVERVCVGQGRRVETADSVVAALEIAVRRPVCVMVADASLHDVGDGVELAKAVHEQNPDVKCFLFIDKESSDVSNSMDNEPWLRFVHTPIPMLRFSADLDRVINESCG